MSANLDPPLAPRNGHTLEVIFVCRVSDTGSGKQDERSLDDQEAEYRRWPPESSSRSENTEQRSLTQNNNLALSLFLPLYCTAGILRRLNAQSNTLGRLSEVFSAPCQSPRCLSDSLFREPANPSGIEARHP